MKKQTELKIGDRVVFMALGRVTPRRGVIVGESEGGHGWMIVQDGTSAPRGVHKTFCQPEIIPHLSSHATSA
jgi:hypothetical protein